MLINFNSSNEMICLLLKVRFIIICLLMKLSLHYQWTRGIFMPHDRLRSYGALMGDHNVWFNKKNFNWPLILGIIPFLLNGGRGICFCTFYLEHRRIERTIKLKAVQIFLSLSSPIRGTTRWTAIVTDLMNLYTCEWTRPLDQLNLHF